MIINFGEWKFEREIREGDVEPLDSPTENEKIFLLLINLADVFEFLEKRSGATEAQERSSWITYDKKETCIITFLHSFGYNNLLYGEVIKDIKLNSNEYSILHDY